MRTATLRRSLNRIDKHIDGLKPDRSDEDLIYEILLKMGYSLTADLAALDVDGLTVYKVDNAKCSSACRMHYCRTY